MRGMTEALSRRVERKTRQRAANRAAILEAARRVAAREGAGALSLRAVAAEAGYAPASVYEYFRNRGDLVLALAAEDLGQMTRALKERAAGAETPSLSSAAATVLETVRQSGALAAAAASLERAEAPPDSERVFNGKLIAALTALADGAGRSRGSRGEQADVVLAAATITGLAVLLRAGRLKALGFEEQELLARLDSRFAAAIA
jgi:AcrR family transcriptional regulator